MLRAIAPLMALTFGVLLAPPAAQAQRRAEGRLLVVVVDPGPVSLNQRRLHQAIHTATERTVIRMTDERAPQADGRLTIAYSRPDRWVLRYEAHGQVAWTSDRIRSSRELRDRLAELSQNVVQRVDGSAAAADRDAWNNDLILALQNEILDPFADLPEMTHRPITVLWSEVVDPFTESPARADSGRVWSEVLDPWSGAVRR